MTLEMAISNLGWPSETDIFEPKGAGARVTLDLARRKIGQALARLPGGDRVRVGLLCVDASADSTEAPIAIVCDFPTAVPEETMLEAHRLAWNFSRAPLLLIVEPTVLRVWTCCEPPRRESDPRWRSAELAAHGVEALEVSTLAQGAAAGLHWVRLTSGDYFGVHAKRLNRKRCADSLLLSNLVYVRDRLVLDEKPPLQLSVAHDLLARIIFVQFLFHRRDASGDAALSADLLTKLHTEGVLREPHDGLESILRSHGDTYRLFRWLNRRFNGDLFPGGATPEEQEEHWRAEMAAVTPVHLRLLSEFVGGRVVMGRGQYCFWPQYRFDAIPLEFISSVYEVFVGKKPGVHYTPAHLVDFMLDEVLPWEGDDWNLRVLDPSCGSGVFLVKAFQRLVLRWRNANPGVELTSGVLEKILSQNVVGVDLDANAVRVASFSLYLAMCDEIEPRHYWQSVRFPTLRGRSLIASDFFQSGLDQLPALGAFDLVVGNAPWGKGTATAASDEWAQEHGWPVMYGSCGPLFLPKASALLREDGILAMLQPSTQVLFSRTEKAAVYRRRLFEEFSVLGVTNLAALRFGLFKASVSPACVVVIEAGPPRSGSITYCCPKPVRGTDDDYRIFVEPHDVHSLSSVEAARHPTIWATLMWGGRRDVVLLDRLSRHPTLALLKRQNRVRAREGVIFGNQRKRVPELDGRRILHDTSEVEAETWVLDAARLPRVGEVRLDADASTDFSSFAALQVFIMQTWQVKRGRFAAFRVDAPAAEPGVLCTQSYVNVQFDASDAALRDATVLAYNSAVATYCMLLTSGRFASYRPEGLVEDLLNVPLPMNGAVPGRLVELKTLEDVDRVARVVYSLRDADWLLIQDLVALTLPEFKADPRSPARGRTLRQGSTGRDPDVTAYCDTFLRVLRAGFGVGAASTRATIYTDDGLAPLPVRIVAIHFCQSPESGPPVRYVSFTQLLQSGADTAERLGALFGAPQETSEGVFFQRVGKFYVHASAGDGPSVPTVVLVKPDRKRYWCGSAALRDADDVVGDALAWRGGPDIGAGDR
jgi:hypothetical protein